MRNLTNNLVVEDLGNSTTITFIPPDFSGEQTLKFTTAGVYINDVLSSADAVGAALIPVVRTYSPTIVANSVNANITAVDTAIGVDNTPIVRTNNPTVANTSINAKVNALDAAIGVDPTSVHIVAVANAVNTNLSALDAAVYAIQQNASGTIASAGTTQGDGPIGTLGVVVVTGADGTKVVTLPAVATTKYVVLYNIVANTDLKVFPATGEYINAAAQNASVKFKHATDVSYVLCTYASAAHWTMTALHATIS
jgi:hypothetical protein